MGTKIFKSINDDLWRQAKSQAAWEGKSLKAWVEEALQAYLVHQQKVRDHKS